jgi:hypothetical protein
MNRRSFLGKLGMLAAGFSILPSATLYTRQWKPEPLEWRIVDMPPVFDEAILNEEWVKAPYSIAWMGSKALDDLMQSKCSVPRFRTVNPNWARL